ncbi:MAG: rod shape-determining protein MreC [Oscillospiraceae bacterium]|nr:rod shape-determining protein MreC [Oscillospiraceae bacterium]
MNFIRRHKQLVVALAVAAAVAGMSLASLFVSGGVSPLQDLLGAIVRPFQMLADGLAGGVGGLYGYIYEYDEIRAENDELRLRIAEQEEEIRRLEEAGEENERLRELVGIKEARPEFEFLSADIISRDMSNWARTFTLGAGAREGVRVGDCVLSAEGYLVGVVSACANTWCDVITVTDTDMAAGAVVYRTALTAVAEGNFELMLNGRLGLFYLEPEADLSIGDLVMTSGTGGLLPKDIPIGKVTDVRMEKNGLSAMAEIEPLAQLDRLRVCYIVINYNSGQSGETP